MMIVIPMAGQSSRFKTEGYETQKYMLEARGRTLFEHSLLSFKKYFKSDSFLFITLIEHNSNIFIEEQCAKLGIEKYTLVSLDECTLGQAHTAYLGLTAANINSDESVLIFNIDTFREGFEFPDCVFSNHVDGYLETFIGEGKNWSNVLPKSKADCTVKLTAEKEEISEFCCTGVYYFRSAAIFNSLVESSINGESDKTLNKELYIAPLYNELIRQGMDIRYTVIPSEKIVFCGIPQEYEDYCNNDISST